MMIVITKRTIKYTKNPFERIERIINSSNLCWTWIMKQVVMMITHFHKFVFCSIRGHNELDLISMILVDYKYTVKLFCVKKLVTRVLTIDESIPVKGNDRTINTTRKENVKGYGEVWFDEREITNILSLKNTKRKSRVIYGSNNDYIIQAKRERRTL